MPTVDDDPLGDKRNVTLIVRILVDRRGQLVEGEVIPAGGGESKRFAEWEVLTSTLRRLAEGR